MTPQEIGGIGILVLIGLSLLRVPLGAAMGLVGLAGYAAIDGWEKAFIVFEGIEGSGKSLHLKNATFFLKKKKKLLIKLKKFKKEKKFKKKKKK